MTCRQEGSGYLPIRDTGLTLAAMGAPVTTHDHPIRRHWHVARSKMWMMLRLPLAWNLEEARPYPLPPMLPHVFELLCLCRVYSLNCVPHLRCALPLDCHTCLASILMPIRLRLHPLYICVRVSIVHCVPPSSPAL